MSDLAQKKFPFLLKVILSVVVIGFAFLVVWLNSSSREDRVHVFTPTVKEEMSHPLLSKHFPGMRVELVTDETSPLSQLKYVVQAFYQDQYYGMPSLINRLLFKFGSQVTTENAVGLAQTYIIFDKPANYSQIEFIDSKLISVGNENADFIVEISARLEPGQLPIVWKLQVKDGQFLFINKLNPNTKTSSRGGIFAREGYSKQVQNILSFDEAVKAIPGASGSVCQDGGRCRFSCLTGEQSISYARLHEDCSVDEKCCISSAVLQEILDDQAERFGLPQAN